MKHYFYLFLLLSVAAPCHAQWQPDSTLSSQVIGFYPVDTNFFVSLTNVVFPYGDSSTLLRRTPGHIDRHDEGTAVYSWEGWTQCDMNHYLNTVGSMGASGPYVFAADGSIERSTDLGQHWTVVSTLDTASRPFTAGSMLLVNGSVIFAGGYRSVDTGARGTWSLVAGGFNFFNVLAVVGPNLVGGADGGIWYSSDSGRTWIRATTQIGASSFAIIDSTIYSDGFPISRSTDFGETWSTVPSGASPGGGSPIAAWGHYLFAGVYDDVSATYGVNVSSDRGSNWHTDNKGLHDLWTTKPGKIKVTALGVSDSQLWVNFTLSNDYRWSTFHRPISELIDTTAGIVQQIPSGDSIEIYPNPTMERVTIFSGRTSILAVHVLNVLGEEALSDEDRVLNDVTIDLSKVPSGTYFVEVETPDGTVLRKLVKE